MEESLCQLYMDKGLISRVYKDLKKLNTKTVNGPTEKMSIELNTEFSKKHNTSGWQTFQKVFSIVSHQKHAN